MTNEQYLASLLDAHTFSQDAPELDDLRAKRDEVQKVLDDKFGTAKRRARYGGSHAKGTMISDSYDLDLLYYFEHDSDAAGKTLEEIFATVANALAEEYTIVKKNSAIRLEEGKENETTYTHVDVVPGRDVDDTKTDVFLHQNEGEKERLRTNPQTHIDHIKVSGQSDIIKLVKLWKRKNSLDSVKTFVLEILVIEVLKDFDDKSLEQRLTHVFTEFKDNINEYSIEDPANPTGNDLSGLFGDEVREALAGAATTSLSLLEDGDYSDVYGEEIEVAEGQNSEAHSIIKSSGWSEIALADCSHAEPVPCVSTCRKPRRNGEQRMTPTIWLAS